MRLATIDNGTPDGRLIVVSSNSDRFCYAPEPYQTLQTAVEDWGRAASLLRATAKTLEETKSETEKLILSDLFSPMPRAWQFLDGSVYRSHADLMAIVIGQAVEEDGAPLMYQGLSDTFYAWNEPVPFPSTDLGIDFEGEFGVIVDHVPMGVSVEEARQHIKLVIQLNDWSLRALAASEMKKGFGWVQAKPPSSIAPFAITPDELGEDWKQSQVQLRLHVHWNDEEFGRPHGGQMEFGFDALIAHAARTRALCAGTIIGSGTVSNPDFRTVGSSCIAERRGIEIVDQGAAKTAFMNFGDTVRMEARQNDGRAPFGRIDQKVVAPSDA